MKQNVLETNRVLGFTTKTLDTRLIFPKYQNYLGKIRN